MAAPLSSSSEDDAFEPNPWQKQKRTASKRCKNSSKRCYMHLISVQKEAVQDFTQTRWDTYRTNLQRWLHLQGESKEIAETFKHCVDINFDNIPKDAGFLHPCLQVCCRRQLR
ncbi:hypothetical protein AAFF_G00361590 [Aldrovandia affinis]|uniref:Uncharacterized protein n=1 Tax=Aldrovandia affinis TaxID=143900 RepID=A0AAD7SHR7_9TELE|nr:hypothetical protein AAFF_G00361590 [Aldrovandia affinis]